MRRVALPAAIAALALLSCLSLWIGAASLDLSDPMGATLLTVSRLPRTVAIILVGASLAVAGALMQQLARNRFVEPGTTGATEAAALGLVLITLAAPGAPLWLKIVAATAMALMGAGLFLALIRRLPPHQVLLVPVVGLILGGVVQGAATFLAWRADLMQMIAVWLMNGEFSGVLAGRYETLWLAGGAAAAVWFAADRFSMLGLGETQATALGLNPRRLTQLGLLAISLVSAITVVTVGMLPFIGLVAPNIVARLMGDNLRRTLPVVALTGALLLMVCDLLGRVLSQPYEIPAGLILGVLGAGVFLALLHGRRHVG